MTYSLVAFALASRQPWSEVEKMDPRMMNTFIRVLEDQADAAKEAMKKK